MKNKKGETIYWEDLTFPVEFRVSQPCACMCALTGVQGVGGVMPTVLTGWVQKEVHIQIAHHSLN